MMLGLATALCHGPVSDAMFPSQEKQRPDVDRKDFHLFPLDKTKISKAPNKSWGRPKKKRSRK